MHSPALEHRVEAQLVGQLPGQPETVLGVEQRVAGDVVQGAGEVSLVDPARGRRSRAAACRCSRPSSTVHSTSSRHSSSRRLPDSSLGELIGVLVVGAVLGESGLVEAVLLQLAAEDGRMASLVEHWRASARS